MSGRFTSPTRDELEMPTAGHSAVSRALHARESAIAEFTGEGKA